MWRMPKGCDVGSEDGKTDLHCAVENGQLEEVKRLLSNKEDRNVPDKDGNTVLHLAAYKADTQIVRELLRELPRCRGAFVNATNNEGLTAFDIAAHKSILGRQDLLPKFKEIKKILKAVGGCRGQSDAKESNGKEKGQSDVKESNGKEKGQSDGKESNFSQMDMLVASLIATVTFAAIFQIPGGIEDNEKRVQYEAARMALKRMFGYFLISDVLAFSASITVIIMWLFRERMQKDLSHLTPMVTYLSELGLVVAVNGMGFAFICASYVVIVPPNAHALEHKKEFEVYVRMWRILTGALLGMPVLVFTIFTILAWKKNFLWLKDMFRFPLWLRLTMLLFPFIFPIILLIGSNIALQK